MASVLQFESLQYFVLQRLSAEAAATVCQLLLWAPSAWLHPDEPYLPSSDEVSSDYHPSVSCRSNSIDRDWACDIHENEKT